MPSSKIYVTPVPKMPPGIVEIMEGLAKDVLKNNPVNIYEFCSQHIKKLIEIRDGKDTKKKLTLDEKISKALAKMRQRAEQRQSKYDKEIEMLGESELITNRNKREINDNELLEGQGDKREDALLIKSDKIQREISNSPHDSTLTTNELDQLQSPDKIEDATKELDVQKENKSRLSLTSNHDKSADEDEKKEEVLHENLDCTSQDKDIALQDSTLSKNVLEISSSVEKEKETTRESEVCEEKGSGPILLTDSDKSPYQDQKETGDLNKNFDSIVSQDGSIVANDSENVSDIQVNIETLDNVKDTDVQDETKTELLLSNLVENNALNVAETGCNINNQQKLECNDESSTNISNILEKGTEEEPIVEDDFTKNNDITAELINFNDEIQRSEEFSNNNCNKEEIEVKSSDLCSLEDVSSCEIAKDISGMNSAVEKSENLDVNIPIPTESTETKVILNIAEPISGNENNIDTEIETQNSFDSSMDLEKAAITIQKVFRAFLFKSKTLSVDDVTNVDVNLFIGNTDKEGQEKIMVDKVSKSLALCRMDTVLQTVNEEKSLSLSTEDSSTLSSAATIIQAHVRGFLARNKMHFDKTTSNSSAFDSDIQCSTSLEGDTIRKNKTVLNIHIVPEEDNFISRDGSILTSADLSLDASPPSSTNLHPLGYNKNERRKQLKREDAVQSISPPTNNSDKQSEDIESVKEILNDDNNDNTNLGQHDEIDETERGLIKKRDISQCKKSKKEMSVITSDEMDVITALNTDGVNKTGPTENNTSKLIHSGEFHDNVLPTIVTRSNTSVVSEFQNVLVYFLLWNTSS